jgi:hypothetical protein
MCAISASRTAAGPGQDLTAGRDQQRRPQEADVSKFIYLYRGPATPMEDFTPEQSAEQMEAWGQWFGQLGESVADAGSPFGQRLARADDGSSRDAGDLNGYTVVEAENLAAATALADKHPFLSEGKGRFSIEIFELIPM